MSCSGGGSRSRKPFREKGVVVSNQVWSRDAFARRCIGGRAARLARLALCGALAVSPVAVLAQDEAEAEASAESAPSRTQLDEMTVTASRNEESIKEVPISVTTVPQQQVEALNSDGSDIRNLSGSTPSLVVESSNGRSLPRFYIRGFGNTDFSTFASQPVGLVYDDIQLSNAALKSFPAFDLASIEVLRGPQGSLFGRNTPAGVVKLESAKPVLGSREGYFSFSTGTYNSNNYEMVYNAPIGNEMALRISALSQNRDDWVDDTFKQAKDEYGGYADRAFRAQLLYDPVDSGFRALLNVHGRDLDGTARLFRAFTVLPGSNDLAPGFDIEKVAMDARNEQELKSLGANARLSWDFDNVTLYSITGYEGINHYFSRGDIDGGFSNGEEGATAFPVETSGEIDDLRQITQELRLASDDGGFLDWQAGVYYFDESVTGISRTYGSPSGPVSNFTRNTQETQSLAGFAALDLALTDRLAAKLGARYTWIDKTFRVDEAFNTEFTGPRSDSDDSSKVSWDTSLSYALTPEVTTYARVATGFRGQSYAAPDQNLPITIAEPEEMISYEVGFKSELLDNRLRLNASAYYYEVDGQQLTAAGTEDNILRLLNADTTVGQGVELDLWAHVSERLLITFGASYNDTELDDPDLAVNGCASAGCTNLDPQVGDNLFLIDGNPLPRAAEFIANTTARYDIPMGDGDGFYLFGDLSYTGEYNYGLTESVELKSNPLLLAGLRAAYTWDYGKYEVAGFCRNCTDEVEALGAVAINNMAALVNEPRIIGVQFKMQY